MTHVQEDPSPGRRARLLGERRADRNFVDLDGRPVQTGALVGARPAAAQIDWAAEDWKADVIVLGSRRLTDLGGLPMGSVGHGVGVIQRTARPVLPAHPPIAAGVP